MAMQRVILIPRMSCPTKVRKQEWVSRVKVHLVNPIEPCLDNQIGWPFGLRSEILSHDECVTTQVLLHIIISVIVGFYKDS